MSPSVLRMAPASFAALPLTNVCRDALVFPASRVRSVSPARDGEADRQPEEAQDDGRSPRDEETADDAAPANPLLVALVERVHHLANACRGELSVFELGDDG